MLIFRSSLLAAALVTFVSPAAQAWDEQILYSFTGGTDGQQPSAGVVFDEDGNLYGAAAYAGADQTCGPSGCGTIFKLTPDGTFSVLHNFNWADGATPGGDLIRDKANGDLYGTLFNGGAGGAGAVYRLAMDGTLTILHAFTDADGNIPEGRLVRDRRGNLYGTTYGGGTDGKGVVYKLSSKGKLKVLHSFTGGKDDGAFPTNAGLARPFRQSLRHDSIRRQGRLRHGISCGRGRKFHAAAQLHRRQRWPLSRLWPDH